MKRRSHAPGDAPPAQLFPIMRRLALLLCLAACFSAAPSAAAQQTATVPNGPSPVRVSFVAASDSFAAAVSEYEQIWAEEGTRIIEAMESVSGLRFARPSYSDTAITALVLEQASSSGYRDEPMRMRASYPPATKRATLIHELGHRLQSDLFRQNEEEHGPLFLWIYDVWTRLYGQQFADEQVQVEKRRRGPYPAAWDSATALTAEQRAGRWRAIRDERLARNR